MAVTDFQQKNDTVVDFTAAGLHSLANGSFFTSAEYDATAAGELNFVADFEFVGDLAAAGTDGNLCDLYILRALDGTNYPDTAGPPASLFAGNFRVNVNDPQRIVCPDVVIPASKFKVYFKNNTGQATAASGSTLKMFPRRQQGTTT